MGTNAGQDIFSSQLLEPEQSLQQERGQRKQEPGGEQQHRTGVHRQRHHLNIQNFTHYVFISANWRIYHKSFIFFKKILLAVAFQITLNSKVLFL